MATTAPTIDDIAAGGGMISVLSSSAVDRRFELGLSRKQDNVSEWEMSIRQYIDEKLMSWR